MRIFLDENVPVQVVYLLRPLLKPDGVTIDHVDTVRWKGKQDRFLIPDCARRGYDVFVTKDRHQLNDADETAAIRKAGIHHVTFRMDGGRAGYARAVASLIAAMPGIVEDLGESDGQRLVVVRKIDGHPKRHTVIDPTTDPPRYWQGLQRRRRRARVGDGRLPKPPI